MDVDPMEYVEGDDDDGESKEERAKEKAKSRLNSVVAVTVALLAAFMALCNVKDGNIVQAMQQNQADKIDNWNFYQARNIRQTVYEAAVDQLKVALAAAASPAAKAEIANQIAAYRKKAAEQAEKKKQQQADAEKAGKDYDAWNIHDDQFDLSEALLSLSIALMAATSLTQKKWLYFIALVPIFFGVMYGLAGLFGWGLHSNFFAKVLGT